MTLLSRRPLILITYHAHLLSIATGLPSKQNHLFSKHYTLKNIEYVTVA